MELIETEAKKNQDPLAEPEPRYRPVVQQTEHGQTWLRLALTILVGIILVVLIVLLARWVYHKIHHTSVQAPTVSTNSPTESSNTTTQPSSNTSSSSSTPSNSSNSTSNSSSNSTATTNTNSQITNTGPGDTAALFAGVSLAAAGLHYIISVRRFTKNDA